MSELNGAQLEPERPKPTPRVLNELVIGGPMHGRVAMIPEDRQEYLLFPPSEKSPLALDADVPVPELYFRAALSGDVGPGGATMHRTLFRHNSVSYEDAFAALTDMLLTAWIKGEVQLGE